MTNGTSKIGTFRVVALAAAAGLLAGLAGLYVIGMPGGNNGVAVSGGSDDMACTASAETLAAVDQAVQGEVAAMLAVESPRALADLSFDGPDGAPMSVADLSGKTLLLNLWATWCAPCREEMPALDALQAEMGSEEFEVVAVNVDTGSDEKPKAFLDEIGIEALSFYRDDTLGLFNELKQRGLALGLPVTLLIDANGCLLAHMNGPADWASPDAKALIEAAL